MGESFNRIYFAWYDHALFGIMLIMSTLIGIYFSFTDRKKKNVTDEYFMGGKKMRVFPIAISLVASHVSSVTLMTVPSDVYRFGAMYSLSAISILFVAITTSYVFLPIFYELQLTSTYEYLKLRFHASIRTLCSALFTINVILYMAIVVYVPALAYSQATGLSIYYVIPIICSICIFYTTIGGLKAVVWTDTLQFSITCIAVLVVFALGTIKAGGFAHIFKTAYEGNRLDFDFDVDPTKRETVLFVLVHWYFGYTRMTATSPECILKFLSLPSLKKAQQSIFVFCIGIIVIKCIIVLTGLIIFTLYNGCDPLQAGLIDHPDQLVPYYVADVASSVPGLTGLFVSGIFCTALSTLSAIINALSATLYQDFVLKCGPKNANVDNEKTSLIIKLLVVVMGVLIGALALLVERLGPILPLAISISSVTIGMFLGLFTLGALCPIANTKGALWGGVSSTVLISWMCIGAQWNKAQGLLKYPAKHLSTDMCMFSISNAKNSTLSDTPPEIFYLYRMSHYSYAMIGFAVCLLVGLIVSFLSKSDNRPIDKRLLSPLVHFLIKDEIKNNDEYLPIQEANRLVHLNVSKEMK